MFRWLALCIVLCAGAFALVAAATGFFNVNGATAAGVDAPPAPETVADRPESIQPAAANALGRGGDIVLPGARLTPIEQEEVPSQHDGTILMIGTDQPADPAHPGEVLAATRVPFLALLVDAKDPAHPKEAKDLPPENEWYFLVPAKASKFKEAVGKERLGDQWEAYKKSPAPVYRRWHEGDPLEPHQVEIAFEQKLFYKLKEGDWVNKDQLVALVDTTVQVNDVSSKVAKLETAEADYQAAIKTAGEATRRAMESERLWQKGAGYISEDTYRADLLNRDRYVEEEKSKDAARKVAGEELSASLTILRLHEIRASIPGVIKAVYKHPGESVKNLDPVVQIQNPLKMRVEALAGLQDAQNLAKGMTVIVEPNRPTRPWFILPGHQAEVTCVAVSRAGAKGVKLIVSGSEDGTVRFWDRNAKPAQVAQLDEHAGVLAVACTGPKAPRNLALTGDRDGIGRIIDLDKLLPPEAAAPVKLTERHKGPITCVAFSPVAMPDGKLLCATGGEDRSIRLWDAADGKLVAVLNGAHNAAITSLQFAQAEGKPLKLVSAGGDDTLCVWNLEKPDAPVRIDLIPYRSGDVAKLGVSADGQYVMFDHGSELRVLSLETRQIVGAIQSTTPGANFTTMALFAPDGNTVMTNSASDGRVQLWRTPGRLPGEDPGRAAEVRQFVWAGGPATCAAFDPDAKPEFAVTGTRDNFVLVWEMPKAEDVLRQPRETKLETKLSLVERSIEAGARQVRVWADLEPMTPEELRTTGLTPGGTATMVVPPAK